MKKIVLIEPGSPGVHVYSQVPIPRVGSVLLGTMLRDRGYEVTVFVENIGPVDEKTFREADLVGISTITSTAPRCYEWARRARQLGIPTVMGGTHATFLPDEALEYSDYVVRGEAEETLLELMEVLEDRGDPSTVAGLSFRKDGQNIHNPDRPLPTNLDDFPIPDFQLISSKRLSVITVVSSRGCPYGCTFCSVTNFNGRRFRAMSVERTLEHVDFYRKMGKRSYIFFGDDIFNLDIERAKAIVRGMIERKVNIPWGAQVRHEASRDEEFLELLRESGCDRVFIGFESVNPKTLEAYGKRETVEEVDHCVKTFHRHGVKVHGMFVVGSDEDTPETIDNTLEMSRKWGIDSVQYMILTPLPGAQDFAPYKSGKRKLITNNWALFDGHHVVHEPARMTPYQLQTETMSAMSRFYDLRKPLRAVLRKDWFEVAVGLAGFKLTRLWKWRDRHYVAKLREMYQSGYQAPTDNFAVPRSVAIVHTDSTLPLQPALEVFFQELGVKVIHTKEIVTDAVSHGYEAIQRESERAGKLVTEAMESLRGEVDLIVRPAIRHVAEESARFHQSIQGTWKDLKYAVSQIPVIEVNLEMDAKALRERLRELALLFTNDETRIDRACTRSLELAQGIA